MSTNPADHNLLFGFLALQNSLVTREQLIAAMSTWLADKSRLLKDIFREQKALADDEIALIAALTEKHLNRHGNDPEKSLSVLSTISLVCGQLKTLGDADINKTLQFAAPTLQNADPYVPATLPVELAWSNSARFQIMRPHARGGLGEVYVARDVELNREVALKEIQLYCADEPQSRARFILEAEITGGLEHPGIVPVYGFGQYTDGRPYYAMRFIRGDSLRKAIDDFHKQQPAANAFSSVDFRNLISRFIAVCNAMEYAHSRGVLHRDLKPGNIMLGPYGETLVVDWGLAKAKGREEQYITSDEKTLLPRSSSGSAATVAGSAIGTPAYMSPEQAAGRLTDLGPPADIYSLGATFYTLLTSRLPIQKGNTFEVLRSVQEGSFARPRELNPRIPKPLEAICLKAMALQPKNRYPASVQLAEDLERWLADEPVSAYRETAVERARRWARRHRALVQSTALAVMLIAIVATAAAILVNQARGREAVAKNQAQQMYLTAQDYLDRWLPGISDVLRYAPGGGPMRQRLLAAAADDYQRLAEHPAAEPRLELERGRTLMRLGDVRRELGKLNEAAAAFEAAESLFQDLGARNPKLENTVRVELARAKNRRGAILEANDNPEALTFWRETAKLLDHEIPDSDTDVDRCLVLAAARISLAEWLEREGQTAAAEREIDAALSVLPETVSGNVNSKVTKQEQATRAKLTALRLKARIQQTEGKFAAARDLLQSAIQVNRPLTRVETAGPSQLMTAAELQIELASVLRSLGLYDEELAAYSAPLPIYRSLLEIIPESPEYREAIVLTLLDRTQLLLELSRLPDAAADLAAVLPLATRLAKQFADVARYHHELAAGMESAGRLAHLRGNEAEARQLLEQATQIFDELAANNPAISEYPERAAVARIQLARCLDALGDGNAAAAALDRSLAAIQELLTLAPNHSRLLIELAWLHAYRGGRLFDAGETDGATTEFRRAIEVWKNVFSKSPTSSNARALADLLANCPVTELRDFEQAAAVIQPVLAAAPHDRIARVALAWANCRLQKPREALDVLDISSASDFPLASELLARANALQLLDQRAAAQMHFDAAIAMARSTPGDENLCRLARETANLLEISSPISNR